MLHCLHGFVICVGVDNDLGFFLLTAGYGGSGSQNSGQTSHDSSFFPILHDCFSPFVFAAASCQISEQSLCRQVRYENQQ